MQHTGINYSNMVWATKDGLTRVKSMDTVHIRNTIRTITNGNGGDYCDHSAEDWITAFKSELKRRDRIANAIINRFPVMRRAFTQVMTQQKERRFTTRGIAHV